jgi:hypothetical protein
MLKEEFVSSTGETEQFRQFYRAFKRDMRRILKPYIKRIKFHKGHFFVYGFFELNDGRIFYFSTGDVRYKLMNSMLVRRANNFEDYTGGSNRYVPYNESFIDSLLDITSNIS